MKVVILAGGFGTRISEESHLKPKPMVEIGGMPILWHIMKIYSHYGLNDFIICCGYKGYYIKEYFANYLLHMSDVTIDLQNSTIETHKNSAEPWRISLIDTGLETGTAGRLQKIKPYREQSCQKKYLPKSRESYDVHGRDAYVHLLRDLYSDASVEKAQGYKK